MNSGYILAVSYQICSYMVASATALFFVKSWFFMDNVVVLCDFLCPYLVNHIVFEDLDL